MSAAGHERERLSAYLDGELPAVEAAAVAAHVGACEECAALLAELAAVDERFAGTTVEAPGGYFDTFAARVRERLEDEPRRAGRRVPGWTWAVAAALLLAVVTPLTLRRSIAPLPTAAPAESKAPAPSPAVGEAPPAPLAGGRSAAVATPLREEARVAEQGKARPAAAGAAAPGPPAGVPRQEAPARAGPHSMEGASPTGFAAVAPAAEPPPARKAAEEAVSPGVADEMTETLAARETKGAAAGRLQEASTTAAPAALAQDGVEAFGATAAVGNRARGGSGGATADELDRGSAGVLYGRLAAAAPRTAAEWRQACAAWRAFAAAHPADPHADEARVRAVEASFEAWRAGGDEADRRALEADARAYLARKDAVQRERVSAVLKRAAGR